MACLGASDGTIPSSFAISCQADAAFARGSCQQELCSAPPTKANGEYPSTQMLGGLCYWLAKHAGTHDTYTQLSKRKLTFAWVIHSTGIHQSFAQLF